MPAGKLTIGEQVKTRQGLTTLTAKDKLAGTHRVYNLEVYRDHNYMVSMDSILVHNTYARLGSKLKVGDKIDLSQFTSTHANGRKIKYGDDYVLRTKKGFMLSPDRSVINPHGGSNWKLLDKDGNRLGTITKDGRFLRK